MWRPSGRGKNNRKSMVPKLILGFTKRNAFRGAELLKRALTRSLRMGNRTQRRHQRNGTHQRLQLRSRSKPSVSTLSYPFQNTSSHLRERLRRLEEAAIAEGKPLTLKPHKVYFETPMTTLSASVNIIKRAQYFNDTLLQANSLTVGHPPTAAPRI